MWRVGETEAARAADRFARRVDLALPPELVPVVSRRLVRRRRANLVAGCVAVAALLVVVIWSFDASGESGDSTDLAVAGLSMVAVVQLALAGAALAAQAGDLAHRSREGPRASHLPRPGLDDYLSPLELWLARGLAAVTILTLAMLAATQPDRRLLGTTGILPLAAGLFVAQAGLWPAAGMALVGLYVVGAVAQSALSGRGSARTHYRRRLWPAARASGPPCF